MRKINELPLQEALSLVLNHNQVRESFSDWLSSTYGSGRDGMFYGFYEYDKAADYCTNPYHPDGMYMKVLDYDEFLKAVEYQYYVFVNELGISENLINKCKETQGTPMFKENIDNLCAIFFEKAANIIKEYYAIINDIDKKIVSERLINRFTTHSDFKYYCDNIYTYDGKLFRLILDYEGE